MVNMTSKPLSGIRLCIIQRSDGRCYCRKGTWKCLQNDQIRVYESMNDLDLIMDFRDLSKNNVIVVKELG